MREIIIGDLRSKSTEELREMMRKEMTASREFGVEGTDAENTPGGPCMARLVGD